MNFIDAHVHLRPNATSCEQLLRTMDQNRVEKAWVVGGGVLEPYEISRRILSPRRRDAEPVFDNVALKQVCRNRRLLPFFFANPYRDAAGYQRIGAEFYGLKLAPAIHGFTFDEPEVAALIACAERHQHPVYTHVLGKPGQSTESLATLAGRFPKVVFIMGHAGIGEFDLLSIDTIKPRTNIYFETSGGLSWVVQQAAKVLGRDRVIFGSEYPLQDQAAEIVKVRNLDRSNSDLNAILRQNAQRLMRWRDDA